MHFWFIHSSAKIRCLVISPKQQGQSIRMKLLKLSARINLFSFLVIITGICYRQVDWYNILFIFAQPQKINGYSSWLVGSTLRQGGSWRLEYVETHLDTGLVPGDNTYGFVTWRSGMSIGKSWTWPWLNRHQGVLILLEMVLGSGIQAVDITSGCVLWNIMMLSHLCLW